VRSLNASAPAPSQPSPQRGLMDSIVQGAIVELFQSCGVAVAPRPRAGLNINEIQIPEVSAAINFSWVQAAGRSTAGRMTLSVPDALFAIMKVESTKRPQHFDWIRELTNQLAARIKHRFLPFDVALQVALPSLLSRQALEGQRSRMRATRIYLGRTLRGEILVTLDAEIDESRLIYAGPADVANEGDVIVF